jgi:cellulose synthase/poly-beta-1,6-N-acetylglucosamine synthase-like glycosyltransferase
MIWVILFWVPVVAILHSYLFYPLIISLLARSKKENPEVFDHSDKLPFISIIMSVYNEEELILEKLRSIFHTSYPEEKMELLVGSDASTDMTNDKLHMYANDQAGLRVFTYDERQGKPSVINRLREEAMGEILILTDANVMFTEDTLFELVKHFKNPEVGLVGANIRNTGHDKTGISLQEWTFISREIKMKYYEGKIWGTMVGAFGGCYAIRNEYYTQVPAGFAVDDFFITMKVLEKKKQCIMSLSATCTEDVSNRLSEEFRRKVRISSGNFQNLRIFHRLLWSFSGLSFSFFSHKVLRWVGPFFLILMLVSNYILSLDSQFYQLLLISQVILLALPIIDFLLRKIGLHIVFLRFITHFYSMNLALLAGFFKYLTGSKTNVWKPTERTEYV